MRIDERRNDDGVVCVLSGRLTADDAEVLAQAVNRGSYPSRRIVLDLSAISMMDAGGLGCLVAAYRHCATNRIWLGLARAPRRVRQLLTLTHLTNILPVFDSVEQACSRERFGFDPGDAMLVERGFDEPTLRYPNRASIIRLHADPLGSGGT